MVAKPRPHLVVVVPIDVSWNVELLELEPVLLKRERPRASVQVLNGSLGFKDEVFSVRPLVHTVGLLVYVCVQLMIVRGPLCISDLTQGGLRRLICRLRWLDRLGGLCVIYRA